MFFKRFKSWKIVLDSFKDIGGSISKILEFELTMRFLSAFFVYPLIVWIFNVFMHKKGFTALQNNDFLKMAFSWQGIIAFFIIVLIALLFMIIEIGGLILVSYKIKMKEDSIDFQKIVIATLKKFPRFIGPGGILMAAYFFLISPILGWGINTSLLSTLALPKFIEDYIFNQEWLLVLYGFLVSILFLFAIRWIFSLHYIILEDYKPSMAMKKSWLLIKKDIGLFIKYFIGIQIASALMGLAFFVLWIAIFLMGIVISVTLNNPERFLLIFGALNNIIIYVFLSLVIPFNIAAITRLFYRLKKEHKEESKIYVDENFRNFKWFRFGWIFKKRIFVTGLIISVFVFTYLSMQMNLDYRFNIKKPAITAHRGSSFNAPENTISALKVAIEEKCDFAEIDVQETIDGQLVVTHDRNVKRFTGVDKDVSDMSFYEIRRLDFGEWFSSEFKGEKVPTLKEMMDEARGKIKLNIELKGDGASDDFVKRVTELIKDENFYENCIVTSLDAKKLRKVRDLDSNIKIGSIIYLVAGKYENLDFDILSVESSVLDQDFVIKAHEMGKEVHVWTANEVEDIEKFILMGVDNIITDRPTFVNEIYEMKKNEDKFSQIIEQMILID
ncbi:MAG: glycerophosphodiester phosphodiesterase [Tissierellales bacterium]|jgi:glycerophosphoryl diester phosphodiesterase|nr:glycerophosphodiester phosphodiesterase [Tissierellales bacterium]